MNWRANRASDIIFLPVAVQLLTLSAKESFSTVGFRGKAFSNVEAPPDRSNLSIAVSIQFPSLHVGKSLLLSSSSYSNHLKQR